MRRETPLGSPSMQPSVCAIAPMRWPARAAALRRLADAEKPLYQSLHEAQKRRFAIGLRFAARRHIAEHHPRG
jgi:hypothetical protein